MTLSKRAAWFLVAVGVWSWVIWPAFLKNIWADDRSWDDGPTGFFLVHLVLTAVSLVIGTVVGWLGVRGVRAGRRGHTDDVAPSDRDLIDFSS
ncbi:SCO4848 family membrane protein [Frankia sp. Cppng1_Ct_nod]|uniref:SCO4848 family membrane protein n=1 Tax=Frankia sp. Cppng1_Ct_nod TaxID=2897162 RepID=UPI00104192B3|nr:hypothetical protein [Frankia sp. Cppng1_Ct_nod]